MNDELMESIEDLLKPFCANDDEFCLCRICKDNQINGGSCSHCCACIDGEKAVDTCDAYKDLE